MVGGDTLVPAILERGVLNSGERIPYAFGISHGTYRGLPTVGHGGADAGYRSSFLRFPDQRVGVSVLCNLAATNPTELVQRVADIYLADVLKPATALVGWQRDLGLVIRRRGPRPRRRLTPTTAELQAFAGVYRSDEIDAIYRVSLKGDALRVERLKAAPVPLEPLLKDTFRTPMGLVRFTRNDAGAVTGLVIEAGRIRGLRFWKESR